MKIKLIGPHAKLWRLGYLRQAKDGRRRIDLVNNHRTDRSTISYARYVMSIAEGKVISDEFEVDHKDTDCSNDKIWNLQVLPKKEHRQKSAKERAAPETPLICPQCSVAFTRPKNNLYNKAKRRFCSRRCSGKFYNTLHK